VSQRTERVALAAVVFAVLFAQVLLYPGVPTLVAALGGGEALVAGRWFLAVEFVGFVVFAGAWGALSDATGRRVPYIAVGAVVGAVGYLALAWLARVETPFVLSVLLRVLQGAATIGAFSLAITMLMDRGGGHGRNMGAAGIAIGLGTALGAPVGGQLYAAGPVVPLLAAALLLFAAAALVLQVPDRAPDARRGGLRPALASLTARPALAIPYAFGFVDRLTAGFFALVGTVYFQTHFGLDEAGTGLVLGAFFIPFALLQYPGGVLSDRVGRVAPVAAGSACYGLVVVAVWLAPTVALAALAMVLVGVCGALAAPATMALVTDVAPERERGVAMGGFNTVGSLGFLVGIVVGSLVAERVGFGPAFVVAGGLELTIALLALPALLRLETGSNAVFAD
jgi:MFS family permease